MSEENETKKSPHRLWAEFRFSVVGQLLAAPPPKGQLAGELRRLSERSWRHPTSGEAVKFEFSTIEAWYYAAKNEKRDPVGRLRSKTRSDLGKSRRMGERAVELVTELYARYPYWSYKLYADNLAAGLLKERITDPPSYPTVRRYMKANGLRKRKKPKTESALRAMIRVETRETRSFEVEYVGALWHLDFHGTGERVLLDDGTWTTPKVLAVFDDHSRLCCHMQWYVDETTEILVHAFMQALMKRSVPAALMTDNGSPMISAEFKAGLKRLGIEWDPTLPRAPHQNGKCEHAWTKVDGRLMAMLSRHENLTLKMLNDISQAWVEMEYNREIHDETKQRPIDRYARGKDVSRLCPSPETLRLYFQREVTRTQRKSDGTIRLRGRRYEIPSRLRHLDEVTVHFAEWDLSYVHVVDFRTGEVMARIYPVDKAKNADMRRRVVDEPVELSPIAPTNKLPPLLEKLVEDYAALGLPPAYLPLPKKTPQQSEGDNP